jgi:hypothetical protein
MSRHKHERDPLHAARKRAAAADDQSFLEHLEVCGEVAVMLARQNDDRLGEAFDCGSRAAIEAEWAECRKRIVFAQFFATEALAHTKCSRKYCRRAKRCAYGGLSCLRGFSLTEKEEIRARRKFNAFIHLMSRPESESEQALSGKG